MMNVKIMELKHAILDKNAEISRLMGEMAFQKRELTEKQIYILSLERQLSEAKKEAQNYKNVLIGQGFENLDSLAYETRDTTQIGVIAKQRTEQIMAQLAEARAELERHKAVVEVLGTVCIGDYVGIKFPFGFFKNYKHNQRVRVIVRPGSE